MSASSHTTILAPGRQRDEGEVEQALLLPHHVTSPYLHEDGCVLRVQVETAVVHLLDDQQQAMSRDQRARLCEERL